MYAVQDLVRAKEYRTGAASTALLLAMVKEVVFSADIAASVQARALPALCCNDQVVHYVTVWADPYRFGASGLLCMPHCTCAS